MFFEMNPLKVEFFDCETFITTIDDLVVSLIEAINFDNQLEHPNEKNEWLINCMIIAAIFLIP